MITEQAEQYKEGKVAKAIEHETAKLPSDLFLWAAGASMLGSLALRAGGRNHGAEFVGLWAPTLLMLGLYNKIGKLNGSDQTEQRQNAESGKRYTY